MSISLVCPSCQARLQAPDTALGRNRRCPACKTKVKVAAPAPEAAPKSEIYEDLEILEDPAAAGSGDFEIVSEEDVVEEVEGEGDPCEKSRLLTLREIYVEADEQNDDAPGTPNVYTLYDVAEDRRAGYAHEVQGAHKGVRSCRIEVTEGKDDLRVLTVWPVPNDPDAVVVIIDGAGKVAGAFKRKRLTPSTKSLWVSDHEGEGVFKLVPGADAGCCIFQDAEGSEVGEVLTESAYKGKAKVRWFRRGAGRYVRFRKAFDGRPRDKLLLLAAALGLDFVETEELQAEEEASKPEPARPRAKRRKRAKSKRGSGAGPEVKDYVAGAWKVFKMARKVSKFVSNDDDD
jgi:hypothetical protein